MKLPPHFGDRWVERLGLPHWEDRLLRPLLACKPSAFHLALGLLLAVIVITMAMAFSFGCSHQWSYAWDSAFALDGGWRLLGGQRPHTDFYCPLGVVPLLVVALGMVAAGPCGSALTYGYAIVFPVLTLAAWGLARRRLPAVCALVFALLVGFTLIATHYAGGSFYDTTYAAQYNRLAWALLCLLLLMSLLPPRQTESARLAVLEELCAGAILALLLFTKITYFGAGLVGVALGVAVHGKRRSGWLGMLSGFAGVALVIMCYLRFDLASLLADMKTLADVQDTRSRVLSLANEIRWKRRALFLLLAVIALFLRPMREPRFRDRLPGWPATSLIAVVVMFLGVFICSTDGISGFPPAFALAALVLAESFRRRCDVSANLAPGDFEIGFKYLLGCALAIYLAGVIVVPGALSVAYSLGWKRNNAERFPQAVVGGSRTMADMIFPPLCEEVGLDRDAVVESILRREPREAGLTSYQYACWIEDGLVLLKKHATADSRIFVIDWVNPFPFALELPSPRGGALYWHAGRVTDEEHSPRPEQVFGEVTLVMVPKRAIQPASRQLLERVYGPLLDSRFQPVGESRLWSLYGRRSGGEAEQSAVK